MNLLCLILHNKSHTLWSMCMIPVAIIARLILFLMGWTLLSNEAYARFESQRRSVVVFSHTSYADFAIFALYALAYPIREHKLRTLVTPKPFEYAPDLLKKLGAIQSTRVEDQQGGATDRVVAELSLCEKFIFFISPKGTLRNTPWKSGYYHIAQKLQAPLIVAGLDYENHNVVISYPIDASLPEPEIRTNLRNKLAQIVPLHPTGEVVEIRPHKSRSIINWDQYIRWFIVFPLVVISRIILYILGWSWIDQGALQRLTAHKRSVVIFSHTTYVDFYILILYLMAHPDRFYYMRTLVKPQPFKYAGWLLRLFGAIPATSIDDKNGGAVNRIVHDLEQEERTIFLISPKGTIDKRPWRSGYYHIAQTLKAPLMIAGLDYEQHKVIVSPYIDYTLSEPEIRDFLHQHLAQLVPLYPECEVVPIRPHTSISVINWYHAGLCLVTGILAYMLKE